MDDEENASRSLYQTMGSEGVKTAVDSPPLHVNKSNDSHNDIIIGRSSSNNVNLPDPATPMTDDNSSNLLENEFPACCKPSSSVSEIFLQSTTYYSSQSRSVLIELLLCILYYFTANFIPAVLFGMSVNQRSIPYQITAAGDVILDMYINHAVVDHETISSAMCTVLVVLIPVLVWYFGAFLCGVEHDAHAFGCAYLMSLGSTEFWTSFFKVYVGYLRPNFYSLCGFNSDSLSCEGDGTDFVQARLSFPSGHSSTSFAAMGIMSLFFLGKIGLHRGVDGEDSLSWYRRSSTTEHCVCAPSPKKKLLAIVAVSPMFWAAFVAASRVHDNYHHPADVVAGALIGAACAAFSYGLWYPSIYSSFAGFPLQAIHEIKAQVDCKSSF